MHILRNGLLALLRVPTLLFGQVAGDSTARLIVHCFIRVPTEGFSPPASCSTQRTSNTCLRVVTGNSLGE